MSIRGMKLCNLASEPSQQIFFPNCKKAAGAVISRDERHSAGAARHLAHESSCATSSHAVHWSSQTPLGGKIGEGDAIHYTSETW